MRNWLHGHWASFVSQKGAGTFRSQRLLRSTTDGVTARRPTMRQEGSDGTDRDPSGTSSQRASNDDDDDEDDSSVPGLDEIQSAAKGRRRSVIILDRIANVGKSGVLSSGSQSGTHPSVCTFQTRPLPAPSTAPFESRVFPPPTSGEDALSRAMM